MLNSNDVRVNRARRAELERAARRQNAARQSTPRTPRRNAWARVAALFV
jgi:hypothetical protein